MSNQPNTLTGPDGRTYHNSGALRVALATPAARRAGWAEGETIYEYWIGEDDDSERLYTTSDFRMQLN